MRLVFETYWPAVCLFLIPYLWRVSSESTTDQTLRHLHLATALRCLIVLLLAFGLMQPVLSWTSSDLSVVYLIDGSHSMAPAGIQRRMSWIQQMNDAGKPSHSQIVAFGANAVSVDDVNGVEPILVSDDVLDGLKPGATNIEGAIRDAMRRFAAHHVKRLVLISDGNENIGSSLKLIPRLKSEGIRVHTVPTESRWMGDTWVENISAPSRVTAGEPFLAVVEVYSQSDTMAEVKLLYGATELGNRRIQLKTGVNRVEFKPRITIDAGIISIIAHVEVPKDPFIENNSYVAPLLVASRPTVLYVEGHAPSTDYLKDALTSEGIQVVATTPQQMPKASQELDAYDALIISDVDGELLGDSQMQAVATYVHDLGGGLIFAGGQNVYGENGYSNSLIEDVLPVTFEARKPPESVAMIVVLDKSGSMEGQNLEMAKEATKAPLDYLKVTDSFGVVAFDKYLYWAVDFQPVRNPQMMKVPISMIPAFGDTNIYPALREAYLQLVGDKSESKHVILLSDGVSLPGEFEQLTKQMAEAGITVSTVAVGKEADRQLLRNIALWGKGRTYYCEEPSRVPQVFVQESEAATGKSLREGPFQPVVKKTAEVLKGIDLETAPELRGYIATTSKATSEVLLETYNEDPILVRWQHGLGRAVAFTSDVKDRWAAEWIGWNGYPKFWSQLVRETMRRKDDEFDMHVRRDGDFAQITITAIQKHGGFRNKVRPQVRVIAPNQSVLVVTVPQTAPGNYEVRVPLAQKGPYLFRAAGDVAGTPSRLLPYSYPDEYHFHSPNIEKLRMISTETGGVFQPEVKDIFDLQGDVAARPTPLWPWFTALALVSYIGDVLLRRVRLFDLRG